MTDENDVCPGSGTISDPLFGCILAICPDCRVEMYLERDYTYPQHSAKKEEP